MSFCYNEFLRKLKMGASQSTCNSSNETTTTGGNMEGFNAEKKQVTIFSKRVLSIIVFLKLF